MSGELPEIRFRAGRCSRMPWTRPHRAACTGVVTDVVEEVTRAAEALVRLVHTGRRWYPIGWDADRWTARGTWPR